MATADINVDSLFITGMQRSGTTLLDKLLGMHPAVTILSQPFPYLFIEAKEYFLTLSGESHEHYPLGNLFLSTQADKQEFTDFLAQHQFDIEFLTKAFAKMTGYSGQCTELDPDHLKNVLQATAPSGFSNIATKLFKSLAEPGDARITGGKEILCEEFLPYLLGQGFSGIIIVRDPRDVLTSLNHGRGAKYGGLLKPTLFNIRNWRKSVAYIAHLEKCRNFSWIRYEDLVIEPSVFPGQVAEKLGISPFNMDLFSSGVKDDKGQNWGGNSSFSEHRGVDSTSVSKYKDLLPAEVCHFIEAVCYPELLWLGYPVSIDWQDREKLIRAFNDPYPVSRPELMGFSTDQGKIEEELKRLDILTRTCRQEEKDNYFLFEDVYDKLKKTLPK